MRGVALLIAIAGVALAACGTKDNRPQTLAYVTETVLAPYCAQTQCHSSVRRQSNYVFDTVDNAQHSMDGTSNGTVGVIVVPGDIANSTLMQYVDRKSGMPDRVGDYMPLDEPLPNEDIVYLGQWVANGAVGYTPPP